MKARAAQADLRRVHDAMNKARRNKRRKRRRERRFHTLYWAKVDVRVVFFDPTLTIQRFERRTEAPRSVAVARDTLT